jgi:hypothetical protein
MNTRHLGIILWLPLHYYIVNWLVCNGIYNMESWAGDNYEMDRDENII